MKKKTTSQLKKLLDRLFSIFIRKKHADKHGNVVCFTCGKKLHWKQSQCGHFVSRQYLATRYVEDNCRPQCVGCNVFGNGKVLDFEENLIKEIGRERVDQLKAMRHEIVKDYPYLEKISHYKQILQDK